MGENIMLDEIKCMNCFQTAYAPICIENEVDPSIMFLWGWGFAYEKKDRKIYNNLKFSYSMDTLEYLDKYAGLQIEEIGGQNQGDDLLEILSDVLDKKLYVVAGMDAFYCPWNLAYQKMHTDHFVNIVGVDFGKKILVCRDWFYDTETMFELPTECFEGIFSVKKIERKKIEKSQQEQVIFELVKAYKEPSDIVPNYDMFMEDIMKIEDIADLFENANPKICEVLIRTRECKQYREGILHFLQNTACQKRYNHYYESMLENFDVLQRTWSKLVNLFLKACVKNDVEKYKDKLGSIIKNIGELEYETWLLCKNYLELIREGRKWKSGNTIKQLI